MAGRRVGFAGVTNVVTAGATETLLNITGAANGDAAIVEVEAWGLDTSASNAKADIYICRQDTSGTGSAVTGHKFDSQSGTITTTSKSTITVEPTSTTPGPVSTKLPTNGNYAWRGYIPVRSNETWAVVCKNNHSGDLSFGARMVVEE